MADYSFQGLNPRDFQHMVQAIARKHIAPGVTAFGDGRDGGRDLTYQYNGPMDYPSATSRWDGYLVLGCKFKQSISDDTKKDGDWAIKQLENDLKKFTSKKRKLKRPDYYLFVTNVKLTAVSKTGTRDKIQGLLNEYKKKLGLKETGIWDYNDLRGFLDINQDIRTAYGHFITTGDVLNILATHINTYTPDFAEIMHTFLQKELITDMSAKLQSAGEDPELQIPLSNVFVDLPFTEDIHSETTVYANANESRPEIVKTMLDVGSNVLRQTEYDDFKSVTNNANVFNHSRYVIMGGPGQGKSTVGQFLCQVYRMSFLKTRPMSKLDPQTKRMLRYFEENLPGFKIPIAKRFPIKIELRTFSHIVASDPSITLFEYIRKDISKLSNYPVQNADLKRWLNDFPWVVILDGLDEVPPSSNRTEIIKLIEHFRIDASSVNADILTIVTTRPQSYSNEFNQQLFKHVYLIPLSAKEALKYGVKLAEARCSNDIRRKEELVRSLEKACQNNATNRLMQSPLQITIMATLLEDTGEPPQQRYRLFLEYYRTIYRRETRRKLLEGILSERQTDIDTIHWHTGLLLHVNSETVSNSLSKVSEDESSLSDDQFRDLVRKRLQHIGLSGDKCKELVSKISDSSLLRLVFLVRPIEGRIRFDIASLKEFMAAEAIIDGPDEFVRERIKTIGPIIYWRNVFLFAVGKCFVQKEYLLDNIVSLCDNLNDKNISSKIFGNEIYGESAKLTLWGSRLALDILLDGTARQYPDYEQRFTKIALDLIKINDTGLAIKLASVYNDDQKDTYYEFIEDRMRQSSFGLRCGAWHLLLNLVEQNIGWAKEMFVKYWPEDIKQQDELIFSHEPKIFSEWYNKELIHLGAQLDPEWIFGISYKANKLYDNPILRIVKYFEDLNEKSTLIVINRTSLRFPINHFYLTPSNIGGELHLLFKQLGNTSDSWQTLLSAARFGESPSAKLLAIELKAIAQVYDKTSSYRGYNIPWPLAACLKYSKSKEDLLKLAELAASGKLGDTKEWLEAELRWKEKGLQDNDINLTSDEFWPFNSSINKIGFPFIVSRSVFTEGPKSKFNDLILEEINKIKSKYNLGWASSIFFRFATYQLNEKQTSISAKTFTELYKNSQFILADFNTRFFVLDDLFSHLETLSDFDDWVEVINQLSVDSFVQFPFYNGIPYSQTIVNKFITNPKKYKGLLQIICRMNFSDTRPMDIANKILESVYVCNDKFEQSVIILQLIRPDLQQKEINFIVKKIFNSKNRNSIIWNTLKNVSNYSLIRAASVALEIIRNLESSNPNDFELKQDSIKTLNDLLTKNSSKLNMQDKWQSLKLPDLMLRSN